MRLHKANYLHLYLAGLDISQSDREEMDRIQAGRDPVSVLTASSDDPTVMCISDDLGNVLAVGGHADSLIWFVHTNKAKALTTPWKIRMFRLLAGHLVAIKRAAHKACPSDYYHFTNIVSVANTDHIRLLNLLGAVWSETPYVYNEHEFRQFFF